MQTIPQTKINELDTFNYAFQLGKKIVFEVNYYRCGSNENKYFTTSCAKFNQPKTDFNHCGQAQKELLKGFHAAMSFYKKWDFTHCLDVTLDQHLEIIADIEILKSKYNFIEGKYSSNFSNLKDLSKLELKKVN